MNSNPCRPAALLWAPFFSFSLFLSLVFHFYLSSFFLFTTMQQALGGVGDQLSSKSWLCSVRAEYLSPVNQTLVEGFLLRLHDLSRGTSEALLLLCGFLIDTARKQNVRASASRISSTQDMNALKHQHLVLPENLPDTALALACRSMKTQQCRSVLLS